MTNRPTIHPGLIPRGRGDRRAFTMLELLVALGMIVVLSAALYASLQSGLKARNVAERRIAPSRNAAISFELMRDDFESALPPTGTFAGQFVGNTSSDDRGHESDDLVFYTTAESAEHAAGNGEIKKVEYVVAVPTAEPGAQHCLIRRVLRNLSSLNLSATPYDEEIICRGIASLALQFFDGSNWQPNWDSTQMNNTLPLAVQATLEFEPTDGSDGPTTRSTRIFMVPCSTLQPGTSGFGGTSGL